MPEHTVEELLGLLDDAKAPEPRFEARLREQLVAELRGEAATAGTSSAIANEEVLELETITVNRPAWRLRSWQVMAAAAAVVVVAATAAIVAARDGGDGSTVAAAPETTFVDATIDTIEIDGPAAPYFVAAGADTWVLALTGDLTHLDGTTGEVLGQTIVPESSPLAVDDNAVWVADAVEGNVLRLDLATGEVDARIPTGVEVLETTFRIPMAEGASRQFSQIGGIVADGTSVWVGDRAGEVLHLDPATNEIDRRLPVPVRPDLLRLDGNRLLVVNLTGGALAVIDTESGEVVHEQDGIDFLVGAALHDGALYVHEGTDGTVTRVDLETGDEVASEPLGPARTSSDATLPAVLVVSDAGALVDTGGAPNVRVLDPTTLALLGDLPVDDDHGDMTLAPDGSAWVVRTTSGTVLHITPRPL